MAPTPFSTRAETAPTPTALELGANVPGTWTAVSPRVTIERLRKTFGGVVAVQDLDLVVEPGQFLVLLGPSGSGKSTLLRCVAGIEQPTSGTIRLGGTMVDGPRLHIPPERRDLAMVFQDYALWPHLSAEQNVAFALRRRRVGRQVRRDLARQALERVGLGDKSMRYPSELSGGEQQRVALARALVARPGLLLFDEPLSNLDADRREQLRVDIDAMVRDQGATVIYITHDQAEAFALADRIGVLDHGRLVQLGSPEVIYRSPATAFVARFTGLAGELSGTVLGTDHAQVEVSTPAGIVVGQPIGTAPLSRAQAVQVLVRPAALGLAGPGLDRGSRLSARIVHAAFRGWGYEHVLEIAGGQRLTGLRAPDRLDRGRSIEVVLDPAGCLISSADPDRAPEDPVPVPRRTMARR